MKGILEILSTTKHSTMKIRKRNGGGSARPPRSMMQSTPDASSTLNASHQTSTTEDKIHNRQSNVDDSGLFSQESTQNFADQIITLLFATTCLNFQYAFNWLFMRFTLGTSMQVACLIVLGLLRVGQLGDRAKVLLDKLLLLIAPCEYKIVVKI